MTDSTIDDPWAGWQDASAAAAAELAADSITEHVTEWAEFRNVDGNSARFCRQRSRVVSNPAARMMSGGQVRRAIGPAAALPGPRPAITAGRPAGLPELPAVATPAGMNGGIVAEIFSMFRGR